MAGLDTGPRHKTRMRVWVASADSGTRARDVPQIQQRESGTRTNVGKRIRMRLLDTPESARKVARWFV